jgi:alpha-D-ribose 1-methylphosphonate 5-triphosphate diphosphatase
MARSPAPQDLCSRQRQDRSEFEEDVAVRQRDGAANVAKNWSAVVEMFRRAASRSRPMTTPPRTCRGRHRLGRRDLGIPDHGRGRRRRQAAGLATVAGAPNVVRGGSHSGGVSVSELAEKGLLDGLSSDYVPASLLQAVLKLNADHGIACRMRWAW